jgi:hypothetical protein
VRDSVPLLNLPEAWRELRNCRRDGIADVGLPWLVYSRKQRKWVLARSSDQMDGSFD